jgi:hypothetical protein
MEGEFQIRSRQDWERGLRGGEIEGNASCRAGALMATKGAPEGIDAIPDCAVTSDGRSGFRVSVIDPWKFKIELMQQSGSEDELGSAVLVHIGQHACVWLRPGTQSTLSPESCTRKTVSKR